MVVTRLRDEAHRFAITYHRNLREKAIRESVLDEISGIGPAKKIALLKKFNSIYGIARAEVDDIAKTAKVGEAIAQAVKNAASSMLSD
jgi:excinuclease ABC subunit C